MKKIISQPLTIDHDYICPISLHVIRPDLYKAHGRKAYIMAPCCKQIFVKWKLLRWYRDNTSCPLCRRGDAKYLLEEYKSMAVVLHDPNATDPNEYLRASDNVLDQILADLNDME